MPVLKNLIIPSLVLCLSQQAAKAVVYPYTISGPMSATLDVNTSIRVPINPMQLCVNYDPYDDEGLQGLNATNHKNRFRTINPSGVRWPQGVWANFYDWESDGRRIFDNYNDTYYGQVVNVPQLTYGFDGLHELHNELNFDVLFTWNICYDDVTKGMARYNDRITKGFDFRWIELGNENFYMDQRSDSILDPVNYPPIASAHSQALKAADPNIMISVPAPWKTFPIPQSFTDALTSDMSYYDAVSLHKYMVGDMLDATEQMQDSVDYIQGIYPGKPIWLTEWAVNGGGDHALNALSTAEIYLYFFNRMDEITMNQNFQVFGGGNFYDSAYNKTSFGACYDIIESVFAGGEMFAKTSTSTEITPGIDAVFAEAVHKDGELVVFAINKSDRDATLTLQFDGVTYTTAVKHEALAFSDANDWPLFAFAEENLLSTISEATTTIVLPALSLNVISGVTPLPVATSTVEIEAESAAGQASLAPFIVERTLDNPTYLVVPNGTGTVNYNQVVTSNQGIATYSFEVLEAGDVTLEVMAKVPVGVDDSFWHRIDGGSWVRHDTQFGNSWKWITLAKNVFLTTGIHSFEIARREDGAKLDRFRLSSTNATLKDDRTHLIEDAALTRIEAEDYDLGGEGVGYHDRTTGNSGGEFRTDHVDIEVCADVGGGYQVDSIQSGEWLQFSLNAESAGSRVMNLRVARSLAGPSELRILIDEEFAAAPLAVPGGSGWTTLTTTVNLKQGHQKLRIKFVGGDHELNYIEFVSDGLPSPWVQADIGAVAAAGTASSLNGLFTIVGSGADIYGTSDEFNYVYQPVYGDCEIISRVLSISNTHPWAKAGVMMRDSLDADSANATLSLTGSNGVHFQRRNSSGETTPFGTTVSGLTAPYWVKLQRVGNDFTASASSDGTTWSTIDTATIPMGTSIYIGLSVTSHNDGVLCTAEFESVSMIGGSNAIEAWRLEHFGTTANTGNAADSFDSNSDGENNLLEFATGQIPSAATRTATPIAANGTNLEFTYTRSDAAVDSGINFTVEWSDSLALNSWSTVDVTEEILSGDGPLQIMKASLPAGTETRRFVRLRVNK